MTRSTEGAGMSYPQTLTNAAQEACRAEGVEFRDVPADGRWHETNLTDDPRGRGDGRIKLFLDGRGGLVHNWKASAKPRLFFVDDGRTLSDAEWKQREQERWEAIKKAKRERERTAKKAAALWDSGTELRPDHPYYARKLPNTIPPGTLREIPAEQAAAILHYKPKSNKGDGEPLAGRLILAPVHAAGKLTTLELIDEAGRKAALYGPGTKPGGCYWAAQPLPESDRATIAIGEGVATVLSVRHATGYHALSALSAGNLGPLAKAMREQRSAARLLILGDLGNGQNKAEKAAREVGTALALPEFTPEQIQFFQAEHGEPPTDFNDLHQIAGPDEVQRQIAAALEAPAQDAATEDDNTAAGVGDDAESGDEEQEEPDSDSIKAAIASARRAALAGESAGAIARRITKQWKSLKSQAADIAAKAQAWANKLKPESIIEINGLKREITDIQLLNLRFAQLEIPGKTACIIHRPDGLPINPREMSWRTNYQVVITGVDSKGQPKFAEAAHAWMRSADKHFYRRIAFTSKPIADNTYNLFTGYGCEAVEGDCGLILTHVREVICAGNGADYEAMLNLLAWQFQNIGTPSRIIVVLFSEEQQTGKGTLMEHILVPLAGLGGFMSSEAEHGFSRFNDVVRGKFIIFLDEACFAGDRKLGDKLKSVAASKTIAIEGKGVPIIEMPSGINLFMATNHRHAAHVEQADARYWMLEVSACRKGNFSYFAELHRQIENGGLEAFLYFLLNRDISGFVPQRDIQRVNDLLAENQNLSLPGHAKAWLRECLDYEVIRGMGEDGKTDTPWIEGHEFSGSGLHDAYRAWIKKLSDPGVRETSRSEFWRLLTKVGFTAKRESAGSRRALPAIDAAREALNQGEKKPELKPAAHTKKRWDFQRGEWATDAKV